MIIFIVSPMGTGKTLTLTMLGAVLSNSGYMIYSNYWVGFPHIPIYDPKDIEDISEGVFLGDELWSWMDARESMKVKNRILSKILLKSRKRNYHILHTAQFKSQPDKRLREHSDLIAVTTYDALRKTCTVKLYTYYGRETASWKPVKTVTYNAKVIFPLYDTNRDIYEAPPGYRKKRKATSISRG